MLSLLKSRKLIAGALVLTASGVQAADVRLNGFASVVGGKTLSQGELADGSQATFVADEASNGVYNEDVSFRPDSIFGLQISAELGEQVSVTGQITGTGGEDFDANVAWAYLTYNFDNHWSVNIGRQRTALFYFSDFLDVGYAYHWIRPPTETNLPIDTYEGIQFSYNGSLGNWDNSVQFYGGATDAVSPNIGGIGMKNTVGLIAKTSTDWLQLRASYHVGEFYADVLEPFGQGKDEPVDLTFASLAAQFNFGNTTIIAEAIHYEFEDALFAVGWTKFSGAYVSIAQRIGSFTPHITYSTSDQDLESAIYFPDYQNPDLSQAAFIGDATESADSITVGFRWDFHRAAAFKMEYQTRSDESDAAVISAKGDALEVDLITMGIDVTF